MEKETWIHIKDFPNYEISNDGKVRNTTTNHFKKAGISTDGFYTVDLYNGGKLKRINIHTLVASTFIDNPEEYKCVKHKDDNKLNNNINNLEWTNFISKFNIISSDIIDQIDPTTNAIIKTWSSYKQICYEYDITWDQLNENIKKAIQLCGYLWRLHPIDNEIENEKWKIIKGYPTHEISNMGRARNLLTKYLLTLTKRPDGYISVSIGKKHIILHRFVAKTFINNPDPKNKIFVNHINGNKENNTVSNLEWVTHSENMLHAHKIGLMPKNKIGTQINQLDSDGKHIKTWKSIKSVTENFNITSESLNKAIINNSTFVGFKWEKLMITTLEGEFWRPVKNNEEYQVSNLGRIKKGDDPISIHEYTYKRVRVNGKMYQLHRLIAEAFSEELDELPIDLPIVNHKDGNKYNNSADNLEWTTYRDNNIHAIETGLNKSTKSQKISCYDKDDNLVKSYNSIREAERDLAISKSCITKALRGKIHTSKGYKWKYD